MVKSLGFGFPGKGVRVLDLGSRVQGSGFIV